MIRTYTKYILIPVTSLFIIAAALVYSGEQLESAFGSVSEEQASLFMNNILNEPMSDKVRDFIVDTKKLDEAHRQTNEAFNDLLRIFAFAIAFLGGWLSIGAYQLGKEAQQGAPVDAENQRD